VIQQGKREKEEQLERKGAKHGGALKTGKTKKIKSREKGKGGKKKN